MAVERIPDNDDSFSNLFERMQRDAILPRERSEVCIFRVPKYLRNINERAYVPYMLSLGPLRDVQRQQSIMEDNFRITDAHKMRAFNRILGRCGLSKDIVILKIKELEEEAKKCYEVRIPYGGDQLAWMLALDGSFILEILSAATLGSSECPSSESIEPIFDEPFFDAKRVGSLQGFLISRDIMLLENQVPLAVLIKLLELELGSVDMAQKKLGEMLNHEVIRRLIPFEYHTGTKSQLKDIGSSKHLLDLLRREIVSSFLNWKGMSHTDSSYIDIPKLCPRNPPDPNGYEPLPENVPVENISMPMADKHISMPSAEVLRNAGIQFERCSDGDRAHIRFERNTWLGATATLFLPKIFIRDPTETILRNLIAYEECLAGTDNQVSLYAILIDDFIESENDVGVLKKAGVICSSIGSDKEVAALFNSLRKGITPRPNQGLVEIISDLNNHYKDKWNVLMAEFTEKYCSKPWLLVSLVAAVMILGMNLLRTIFSIIDRY